MRTLSIERLYTLGQYQNIKIADSIVIPDGKEFDKDLADKIRYLQLLEVEQEYREYIKLAEKLHGLQFEEAIDLIEGDKLDTLESIKRLFEN